MSTVMLETKRLRIYPAAREQMEALIASETNGELKAAYQEMLAGGLRDPCEWEWYALWMIELKDGTHIGELCFKGLDADGAAEIGYGILEAFQGHGYATEAVKAVSYRAFDDPAVTAVEAETAADNRASQRVLEKCGFASTGRSGKEGPRFILTRDLFSRNKQKKE